MRESRHLPRMKIMGGILSRVRETRHGRKKKNMQGGTKRKIEILQYARKN